MKSSGLAAVLSLLFPGVGQVYNGRFLSALMWFGLAGLSWLLTMVFIGYLTTPVIHFLSAVFAYRQAEAINSRIGSRPSF
jgi:TM2 domain-containing membrane protein YozV